MKIFFYLPNLVSGGAEKMIIALANEMAENNYNVTLVVGVIEGDFKNDILKCVTIIELGVASILKSSITLFKVVKKEKPDILCVTKCHINTVVSLFTPFLKETKVVLREANTPSVEYMYSGFYGRFILKIGKFTYKLANSFVAVSKGVSHDMIGFYGLKKERVKIIYNPVISSELFSQAQEEVEHRFFEERKNNKGIYVFLAIGRLMRQKDYSTMIEAFNVAYTKNDNIRLIILGRVEKTSLDYNLLRDKIEKYGLIDAIDYVGFVNNPFKYLSRVDCFLQTSLFEGLPGALVQALALKKNIIATNCKSGPEEILDHGKYGTLVEIKNIKQIGFEILEYSRGKTNLNAQNHVMDRYTSKTSIQSYIELFEDLINKQR
ncbi:MAG: glycosyltransferase involved in cell wall biosynthesis [bacterium]|jgi:glycosyltransferase involved in cell wall biosynthesis